MANTYYDSQLTAEEIEEVLEAINGILTPANNGKVLAISNGKFEARSVQWGGGEPTIEPLSVTANGTYTAPSGVDGYSPITVNVSGGGSLSYGLPNSVAQDIIAEADAQQYSDNDTSWGGFTLVNPTKFHKFSERYVYNEISGVAVKNLTESNHSFTAYLVASCNQPISASYGRYICSLYGSGGSGNMVTAVTYNGYIGWSIWGTDGTYPVSSNIFDPHVICMAIDASNKTMNIFIDGVKYNDIGFSNSGNSVTFCGQADGSVGTALMTGYMAVVDGREADSVIIANSQYLMSVLQTV